MINVDHQLARVDSRAFPLTDPRLDSVRSMLVSMLENSAEPRRVEDAVNAVKIEAEKHGIFDGYTDDDILTAANRCINHKQMQEARTSLAVQKLALLDPAEYDRQRRDAAKIAGVRATTMDELVKQARNAATPTSTPGGILFNDVVASPVEIPLSELLDSIATLFKTHVVLPNRAADSIALWIVATWAVEHVYCAPILLLRSPEPRCGKSTTLDLLSRLVRRALPASNITPAALFRVIERHNPTMLIDEGDSFLAGNDELRGVINAGHTRTTAYVVRTVGDDHEPQRFGVFGFKALALIGKAPHTITDRSIVIELRRKLPSECVKKLRDMPRGKIDGIISGLARWVADHACEIEDCRPEIPTALNDRAGDSWTALLAIADLAGGEWPFRAREAAKELSASAEQEDASVGSELLADVRRVFEERGVDRIAGDDLLAALLADAERPWATFNKGKPLSRAQLARRLSTFGVSSGTVRLSSTLTAKGYKSEQFADAFARYLTRSQQKSVTSSQPNNGAGCDAFVNRHKDSACRFEKASQPNAGAARDDVTLSGGAVA